MALLTPVGEDEARALGALFGLRVASIRPILQGSVNTNAELVAEDGVRWFLRVYEEQTVETARHEAAVLAALAAGGVPTPTARALLAGGSITTHRGKPVALFPFVSGEVLCQKRVTAEHTRAVGAALARVHQVGHDVLGGGAGRHVRESRFGPGALALRLAELAGQDLPAEVEEALVPLSRSVASRGAGRPAGETGFVHGDLFRDNVLFDGASLSALLDFESASRGPLAFDLAVTLLAWCYGDDLDLELAGAMARSYAATRPLAPATRAALFDEALFACTRFTTTRITDFELRPRGVGVYKDFRRWQAREAALRGLGRERLDAALFG